MKLHLVCLVGVGLMHCLLTGGGLNALDDDKPADAQKFQAKDLIGNWKVTRGQRSGYKIEESRLPTNIIITDKQISIESGDNKPFKFAYVLDTSKAPITIDLKITDGPVKEGKAVGILKVVKGKVVLCYDSTGKSRPKDFITYENDGRFLFVLEKEKQ